MKKLIGFMMIITLPLLCLAHVIALVFCLPFIAIYSALHQAVLCIKELFDLRNTGQFAKKTLETAYKLLSEG